MKGNCLVLGSARCLFEDIEAALALGEFHGVVAAKHAGALWPGKLDAWVTLHPDQMARELAERSGRGYPYCSDIISHVTTKQNKNVMRQVNYRWPVQKKSGSSGLFAVKVALEELGYTRVVLCGIPLSAEYGKLDGAEQWRYSKTFRDGFLEVKNILMPVARSMSGWTKSILGAPTEKWLTGE